MSFYNILKRYENMLGEFKEIEENFNPNNIERIINKPSLSEKDFYMLLSEKAEGYLEPMAQRASKLTMQNFGKVVVLYTPLYLANYCENECVYCGFNVKNTIERHMLSLEELEREAEAIANSEIRHILILTGESRRHTPVSYIRDCVKVLRKYFNSISIEIYPLEQEEYEGLISEGVDGLTIYQEVYDEKTYDAVHLKGPKKDYKFRLDAPERGCKAGMRSVNIGPLLGLGDNWRQEAFFTGLHASYLQNKYLDVEINISLPRLRPHAGEGFKPKIEVTDKNLVQILLALRIFLPRVGVTISTRESEQLRDNLLRLGVTRMSAGSNTEVGGRTREEKTEGQFEISDSRNVDDIHKALLQKGFQPIYKDWDVIG